MSLDYERYYEDGWKNKPDRSTPVVAEALNNIDDAIIEIEDVLKQGVSEDATIVLTESEFEPFFANKGSVLIHEMLGNTIQDGTPSPTNPVDMKSVKVDVKTQNKNLVMYPYKEGYSKSQNGVDIIVNSDGSITLNTPNGASTGTVSFYINSPTETMYKLDKNKRYIASDGGASVYGKAVIGVRWYTENDIPATNTGLNSNLSGGPIEKTGYVGAYFYVWIYSGAVINNVTFKPMLTEISEDGSYSTDFVKGENSVADTSIILRSIGDVKDKLFFEAGKFFVERRIKEVKLSDVQSTVFASAGNDGEDTKCYRWELDRFNSPNGARYALCNVNEMSLNTNDIKSGKGSVLISGNVLYVYLSIPNTITTTDDANEFIVANNVSVIYKTDVPIIEEVSTDDAIKLLSLMAFDGETHIIQDSATKGETVLEYPNNRVGGLALTGFCKSTKNEIKIDTIDALMTTMMLEEDV